VGLGCFLFCWLVFLGLPSVKVFYGCHCLGVSVFVTVLLPFGIVCFFSAIVRSVFLVFPVHIIYNYVIGLFGVFLGEQFEQ